MFIIKIRDDFLKSRTVEEINYKISNGEANIFTAQDLKELVRNGEVPDFEDVDVVTCGTCGIMSGTAAIFHLDIFEPGIFKKAKNIYLNGVQGFSGPCPNEWLGSIDTIVYGTTHSRDNSEYGGGFLFKDLLEGKEIDIDLESIDGKKFSSSITIEDIPRAEIIGTRMAFKNYTAFINPSNDSVSSIFNAIPMEGNFKSFSFSGCGDINPIQNDPNMDIIKKGTKVLLNGSEGIVLGNGTRSNDNKPNMMLSADMHQMDSEYFGGFKTSEGPEIFDSVALPIPILNEKVFSNLLILNKDINLPIADIRGRHLPLSNTDYSQVWESYDERPTFHMNKCIDCSNCLVEERCPTFAYSNKRGNKNLDTQLCFGCGMCSYSCIGGAFEMDTGVVNTIIDENEYAIPISCRQSDIKRAKSLTNKLKEMIENKEFML